MYNYNDVVKRYNEHLPFSVIHVEMHFGTPLQCLELNRTCEIRSSVCATLIRSCFVDLGK